MGARVSRQHLGIGGHHRGTRGKTDVWLTPPEILVALGEFALDPCCPPVMPWRTARVMLADPVDGLAKRWHGRVWLNAPYGPELWPWLAKLAEHGDGIAIAFARTETAGFFAHVWERADALLFLKGRLHFHHADGERAPANAGGPTVLIAYGPSNAACLESCGLPGAFVRLKCQP
jgi:hypothetical protein